MINFKVEINEIQNKNNKENHCWFPENTNKIDKPLARMTKKIRKKTQLIKIRNEMKDITIDSIETKRIIYYE